MMMVCALGHRSGRKFAFLEPAFAIKSLQYCKYQIYNKEETDMFECSPTFSRFQRSFRS